MPPVSRFRAPLVCDKCRTPLPGAVVNHAELVACPGCHASLMVEVFPAFFRPLATGQAAENVVSDEDASCFYHPAKKAVVPCARCGRFLCALCDIDLGGNRHVCPGCVEAARREPAASTGVALASLAQPRQVLHDQMALTLALVPLCFLGAASVVTAPIAIFLAIRYWNEPKSYLVPRGRGRLIAALVLSLLTLAGWIAFGVFFFNRHTYGLG